MTRTFDGWKYGFTAWYLHMLHDDKPGYHLDMFEMYLMRMIGNWR